MLSEQDRGARSSQSHIAQAATWKIRMDDEKASEQQKTENDKLSAELISEMRHFTEGQKSLKMLTRISSCVQVARDHEVSIATFAEEL